MSDQEFDVVFIGGGPGGYTGAIRAGQLGLKTACVEMRGALGGTCLNVGCIPSKALLQSSEKYAEAEHALAEHGVAVSGLKLDLKTMLARKDKVVDGLTQGIEFLFKKNKVSYIKGRGTLLGGGRIKIEGPDAGTLKAKHIVLSTGSEVMPLPGVEIDEKKIVSSTGGLALPKVPKELVVIGAGYIGLELGTVWRRLGAKVTVVEFLDRILPGMDAEIAKTMQRILKKQGIEFRLGKKVTAAKSARAGVTLTLEPAKGGEAETLKADVVLVSIGRRPYVEGLGLETAGIALTDRGRVKVDDHYRTSAEGVYAIGDVIDGPMLAHKAEEEGVVLAEMLSGQKPHMNYDVIPGVVYTWPECATVGKTEEQLKEAGTDYKVGKFPFSANSRARANGDTEGMVKVLADARTDRVLGVHIIGPEAGNMIHEAVLAMEFGASAEDIARTCHAHPTLNEAVREAALNVDKLSRQM
ncbi:dihydrolipoyl dehydrogenase [Oceanibacterium hippocampi]|uniref:Dihydrolipoyl dehydrogenase n=1 Tax=Oceanibacterium hippocampi TaxID=745714 RepID=A0A1Y5RDM4_9PROT|nr:dihydrolipoyl dehydrogenase [Oceanibacterium hippocampi]SLN13795.1 Dihydrolipoyl dehydrogenase 3 [Oceanibacterium hippocampi]